MAITPEQLAKNGSEDGIQAAYFCSLVPHTRIYPCLRWIHAIPNGGKRDRITSSKLAAGGVTAGVWDVHIPIPTLTRPGAYIEFKRERYRNVKNGGLSVVQQDFREHLIEMRYDYLIAYGWEEALEYTLRYVQQRFGTPL